MRNLPFSSPLYISKRVAAPNSLRRIASYGGASKETASALIVERKIEAKYTEFATEGREKCPQCWLYKSICMCERIAKLRQQVTSDMNNEVVVFMHHKEYGRASNTGKLASLLAPSTCTTEIYGTRRGSDALLELCEAEDKQLVILYPSSDSLQLSGFRHESKDVDSTVCNMIGNHDGKVTKKLVLVVLDGTWQQAGKMNKKFPSHIPRVHIDDQVNMKSLYLCRKQAPTIIRNVGQQEKFNKVSTVESIQKALRVLGEPPDILAAFSAALKLTVDSNYVQKGERPVYGNVIKRVLNQGDEKVYDTAKTMRPSECPECGQTEKRFHNYGRTKFYQKVASIEGIDDVEVKSTKSGLKYKMLTTDKVNQKLDQDERVFEENMPLRKWKCKICKEIFLADEIQL